MREGTQLSTFVPKRLAPLPFGLLHRRTEGRQEVLLDAVHGVDAARRPLEPLRRIRDRPILVGLSTPDELSTPLHRREIGVDGEGVPALAGREIDMAKEGVDGPFLASLLLQDNKLMEGQQLLTFDRQRAALPCPPQNGDQADDGFGIHLVHLAKRPLLVDDSRNDGGQGRLPLSRGGQPPRRSAALELQQVNQIEGDFHDVQHLTEQGPLTVLFQQCREDEPIALLELPERNTLVEHFSTL